MNDSNVLPIFSVHSVAEHYGFLNNNEAQLNFLIQDEDSVSSSSSSTAASSTPSALAPGSPNLLIPILSTSPNMRENSPVSPPSSTNTITLSLNASSYQPSSSASSSEISPPSRTSTNQATKKSSSSATLSSLRKLAITKRNHTSRTHDSQPSSPNKSVSPTSTTLSGIEFSDYFFSYEAVMEQKDAQELFLQFLSGKKTQESLLFIMAFGDLKRITIKNDSPLEQKRLYLKRIEEIYAKFFAYDSSVEVNLPQNLHEPISKLIDQYELKKDIIMNGNGLVPDEEILFLIKHFSHELKRVEAYLNISLKESYFQEFIDTTDFKNLVISRGKVFLSSISELKPFSHTGFVESLIHEMSRPRVTVKQAKQIKHIVLKSPNIWSQLISAPDHSVHLSNNQYLIGKSDDSGKDGGVHFFKYDIVFPYRKQDVMTTLLSSKLRFKFDKNTKSLSRIDYGTRDTIGGVDYLATCITQEVYGFPFPFQSREFVLGCSLVHDTTDDMDVLLVRSCESSKSVKLKKTVLAANVGMWSFQSLNNGTHCRFVQFVGADFRGVLPKSLVVKNVKKRAKYYYRDALKLMEEEAKKGFSIPINDPIYDGFMNSLRENGSIAL